MVAYVDVRVPMRSHKCLIVNTGTPVVRGLEWLPAPICEEVSS